MHNIVLPQVFPVACHTDHIGKGSTFVAIKGMKDDGIRHISAALARGATKIVVEQSVELAADVQNQIVQAGADVVRVSSARKALAELSAQASGYPAQRLKIIGITGTKGKSTTTFLIEHLLRTAGYTTALLSTVNNRIGDTIFQAPLTTAQPDYLQVFLRACVDAGVEWVVMEVAAQAFSLHRVDGILFDVGVFTNFSQEHLEFYQNMHEYFEAKKQILSHLKQGAPLITNRDDEAVDRLAQEYSHTQSCSLCNAHADFYAQVVEDGLEGLKLAVMHENKSQLISVRVLTGLFNAENVLMACAAVQAAGVQTKADFLETFAGVPGRLNRYATPKGTRFFIDYAHNPSSFEAVLSTLRQYTDDLVVVFGAGGERDRTKRPLMGHCAVQYADKVVLTSDNPRSENPAVIVQEIMAGIPEAKISHVLVELDREKAIRRAYELAGPSSIVVLLGKGPDEYQLIQGIKYPFSERAIIQAL